MYIFEVNIYLYNPLSLNFISNESINNVSYEFDITFTLSKKHSYTQSYRSLKTGFISNK